MVAALLPVVVLAAVGTAVTVPFVALGPGPTFNTLGELDDRQVVDVQGAQLDPTTGNLNMTTVSVLDGITIFEAFAFWASGSYGLVPRSQIYPPGLSREEIEQSHQREFENSEGNAEIAALRHLDLPVVTLVNRVSETGPADGVLRVGDELVGIDGTPITTPEDVVATISSRTPGSPATVVYRRDTVERTTRIVLGAHPDDATKGFLGIGLRAGARPPLRVTFNLAEVGGPSAGLMFSLAVIDKLSPGELTGGRFVAGSGTIDPDGTVGPIGGIQYKMITAREDGAQTFLVPAANCAEARQRTPEGLRLVKVDDLAGAVQSLEDLAAGKEPASCG